MLGHSENQGLGAREVPTPLGARMLVMPTLPPELPISTARLVSGVLEKFHVVAHGHEGTNSDGVILFE